MQKPAPQDRGRWASHRGWGVPPHGMRALTTDQPPAQLPDALLTGFFPLKFTPKVRQHAGGALVPTRHAHCHTDTGKGQHVPGRRVSR